MRRVIKLLTLWIVIALSVLSAGSALSGKNEYAKETLGVSTSSIETETTASNDDELLSDIAAGEAWLRFHPPSVPSFSDEGEFSFSVNVEGAEDIDESFITNHVSSLHIRFEEEGKTYDNATVIEELVYDTSSELKGLFDFSNITEISGKQYVRLTTLGDGLVLGGDFEDGENYQYRICWEEKGTSSDGTGPSPSDELQYTKPTSFTMGSSAPTISFAPYFGYNQAVIRMQVDFPIAVVDEFAKDGIAGVYDRFYINWGSTSNNFTESNKDGDEYYADKNLIYQSVSDDYSRAEFYLLFDGLSPGDLINISVDYEINSGVFGTVGKDTVEYSTSFIQNTYIEPEAELSEPIVYDLATTSGIDKFTDVDVDLYLDWLDTNWPIEWQEFSDSEYDGAGFVSEAEYWKVIKDIDLYTLEINGNDVLDETSYEINTSGGAWSVDDALWEEDGTPSEEFDHETAATISFENLEYGQTYDASFEVTFQNPQMFGQESKYVMHTGTVSFTIPDKADEATLTIDSIEAPAEENKTPADWTSLNLTYSLQEGDNWAGTAIDAEKMFDRFEVVVMNSDKEELFTQSIDPEFIEDESTEVVVSNLNSDSEYFFKLRGFYTDEYARVFGYDPQDTSISPSLESEEVSSSTRAKSSAPTIVANSDYHDDELEEAINGYFTYGFNIYSPSTWEFATDSSSAYYVDNVIDSVYITHTYFSSDASLSEDGAQELYDKEWSTVLLNDDTQVEGNEELETTTKLKTGDGKENRNYIRVDSSTGSTIKPGAYNAELVMQLDSEAYDPNTGWINASSDGKITQDITVHTTEVAKAPVISVKAIDGDFDGDGVEDSWQWQNEYSNEYHTANLTASIDINEYAENIGTTKLSSDEAKSKFEENAELYDLDSTVTLVDSTGAVAASTKTFEFADHISELEYSDYVYTITFSYNQLEGNENYTVRIDTSVDISTMEKPIQATYGDIKIDPNESLDSFGIVISGYEFGSQNEGSNYYDKITVELSTLSDLYGDSLGNNIENITIINSSTEETVLKFANPSTINTLTTLEGTLINPVKPNTEINLGAYSLRVENDEHTEVFTDVPLTELIGEEAPTTITTGALNTPEITNFAISAFGTSIKYNFNVTDGNNVKDISIDLYELDENVGDAGGYGTEETAEPSPDIIPIDTTTLEEGIFDYQTSEDYSYTAAVSPDGVDGDTYYQAKVTVNLKDSVENPETLELWSNVTRTPDTSVLAKFNVSVEETYDLITVNWDFDGNTSSGSTPIEYITLEVVDKGAEELIKPVIFSETVDGLSTRDSDSGYFSISTETLLEGYELYSNQEYRLDFTYTTNKKDTGEMTYDITSILNDPESYTGLAHTAEKEDAFFDSIYINQDNITEESFTFAYSWFNKESNSENMKNITSQSISLYEGDITTGTEPIWTTEITDDNSMQDENKTAGTLIHDDNESEFFVKGNEDGDYTGDDTDIDTNGYVFKPNSVFTLESHVVYDTYEETSRVYEEASPTKISVNLNYSETTFDESITSAEFIDRDSVLVKVKFDNIVGFAAESTATFTLSVFDGSTAITFMHRNVTYSDGEELTLTSPQITDVDDSDGNYYNYDLSKPSVDDGEFDIQLDGITPPASKLVTIHLAVKTTRGEDTLQKPAQSTIVNQGVEIASNNMYVLERKYIEAKDVYIYEIAINSDPVIGELEVYISAIGDAVSNAKSEGIEVMTKGEGDIHVDTLFGDDYSDNRLYLEVDSSLIPEDYAAEDLTFLLGRAIAVKDEAESATRDTVAVDTYTYFWIDDFNYPPKTIAEILTQIIVWLLLILLILLVIGGIGAGGYYAYRFSLSNHRWKPIVAGVAKEKFDVFINYVEEFGWTHKYQELEDIKNKDIEELREYALKMNIPVTYEMDHKELVKVCSLLTAEEIEDFDDFIESDIDVRHFEVADKWREESLAKHGLWLDYKMKKMLTKGLISEDDERLKTLYSELAYVEKEKQLHAEREEIFEEIKSLVGDVLDTNIDLTSEFNIDPIAEFREQIARKAREEEEARLEDLEIQREIEEIEAAKEAGRIAKEQEKIEKEKAKAERKAAIEKEKKELHRLEEINELHKQLSKDFKEITVDIDLFNSKAVQEVPAEFIQQVTDDLKKHRDRLTIEMEHFKERQHRLVELDDAHQSSFGLKTLKKVKITIKHSKLAIFAETLKPMTKKELFDVAKEYDLKVKSSLTKDALREEIVRLLNERGDF